MRYHITIGPAAYPPTRLIETPWAHFGSNRLYVCPQCGEIWARWTLENVDPLSLEGEWHPFRRSCPNHALGYWPGDEAGSLILNVADAVTLPRELLIRELFLNRQPKEQDHEQQSPD